MLSKIPSVGARTTIRAIVLAVAILIIAMWGAVALSIGAARQSATTQMHREAQNLAAAFAEGAAHVLDGVAAEIDVVAGRVRAGRPPADLFRGIRPSQMAAVDAVVVGPDGVLVAAAGQPHPPALKLGDRAFFRMARDGRTSAIHIGDPAMNGVSQEPTIAVSRRIDSADGRFLAVVAFGLPPAALTRLQRAIDLGPHGIVRLTRIGDGEASLAVKGDAKDPFSRLYGSRRLANYPLAVTVGIDLDHGFGAWRSLAITIIAMRFGATVVLVGLAAYLIRRIFRDAAAAHAATLAIAHTAEHDFLTGLPNRMLLNDRIGQAIALARRHKSKLVLLFLDLDGFKHINDSLGHPTGDRVLQSVAGRLLKSVRASDTVSRTGGDEFVVLLSEVQRPEDAAHVAQHMLQVVAEAHSVDSHDLHVTTSIGVSVYPEDGLDAETLVKNADTAMYQAKEAGRQCYRFFTRAMNERAVQRQFIEQGLRRALERNEFALHYQPKIDLETGAITGAEALLRWTHPTRGAIPPAEFIPVAEDCGLIVPIGNWVVREACAQARAWVDAGLPATAMAVNVSAMEFREERFLGNLFQTLDETGLDPRLLEVELTENLLVRHAESAAAILDALRQRGVQVALDDFGTGYSSLSYLRKFPLDAIKIDQSFVRQISAASEDTAIVTAVIGLARGLRLRVVAEGVETPEQVEFLRRHHCDEAQGYHFSRPLPADRFAELLGAGAPRRPSRETAGASAASPLTAADTGR